LLDAAPPADDPAACLAWQLRLEGIAREIDAGFTADQLPPDLADVRARIVSLFVK
jgi:MoxR-like ATPase